jgi:hypothetical protein
MRPVQTCMTQHHLKVNQDMTEVLELSSKQMVSKMHVLQVGDDSITLVTKAKSFGIQQLKITWRHKYHQCVEMPSSISMRRCLDRGSLETGVCYLCRHNNEAGLLAVNRFSTAYHQISSIGYNPSKMQLPESSQGPASTTALHQFYAPSTGFNELSSRHWS